jgi:hypothetical protein
MENAVNYLVGHPVLFVIAVLIAIIILLPFFRKIVQVLLVSAAFMLLYAVYLHFTGGKPPELFRYIEHAFSAILLFVADTFKLFLEVLKSPKK